MKLKKVRQEIPVAVSQEAMWEILSQYGDVSDFHAGVVRSYRVQGSENQAALGCERVCEIVDMGLNITLNERIIDFVEGKSYKYEVYEWKNFPIRNMFFEFSIHPGAAGQSILALEIEYKAKPALLTPLMAGKMKALSRDVLMGYKHYAETGASRTPIKQIKAKYKSHPAVEVQYG